MKAPLTITVPLGLLAVGLAIISLGGYAAALTIQIQTPEIRTTLAAALFFLGMGWVYLLARIFRFYSRLCMFFRRLLANDYSTGIREVPMLYDEIATLTELINKSADRLRSYDDMRAECTGMSFRAMDLLFRSSEQGIILADTEKKVFRFNPVAQKIYDVKQETYPFETIEKQEANTPFFTNFLAATIKDAVARETTAVLQLPQRETARELCYRLEPLKDNTEKVRFTFIFIASARCLKNP